MSFALKFQKSLDNAIDIGDGYIIQNPLTGDWLVYESSLDLNEKPYIASSKKEAIKLANELLQKKLDKKTSN